MERYELLERARRWLKWSAILFAIFLFMTSTWAFYDVKFHRTTGEAEWLWGWNWASRQKPLVFFASHDFPLDDAHPYVRIKVACDPMYTLFFNEVEVGGGRWADGESIDVYDVTDLAIAGMNRIVVAVRAPDGVGGLLAAVDTSPLERNIVVTGEDWRISEQWSPSILRNDDAGVVAPRTMGRPPNGEWDFPPEVRRDRYEAGGFVRHPIDSTVARVTLPNIAVVGGVAIAGREDVEATVFDFGEVNGRPRVTVESGEGRVVRYRTVHALQDLREPSSPESLVLAPGEVRVTEPAIRGFRYFVALDPVESVEVLSEAP